MASSPNTSSSSSATLTDEVRCTCPPPVHGLGDGVSATRRFQTPSPTPSEANTAASAGPRTPPRPRTPPPTSPTLTSVMRRLRRVELWLLQGLHHGRAERRLLEDLIHIKEEDLEDHRRRLAAAQARNHRLRGELGECRCKLQECRRENRRVLVDNMRLRAKNSELRVLIGQVSPYMSRQEKNCWVQYTDTAL